jgi:hypothetical protein
MNATVNDFVPSEFYLGQNYPNPFKDKTTIKYCVPQKCRVILSVYNADGTLVRQLVDEEKPAGTYEIIFKQENVPAGISLQDACQYTETRKWFCQNSNCR